MGGYANVFVSVLIKEKNMIGRLNGILLEKQPPFILLDVNGVGYECQAPMNTIYHLPELGDKVLLHTHLSVSENAHTLFAFFSLEVPFR